MDNHTGAWSDTDIQRYLKGELSPREMHALEKAALDDPFLADALEGLQEAAAPGPAGEPLLQADLDELRSRLVQRVSDKQRSGALPWFRRPALRVAASVILLLGMGLSAYYILFRKAPAKAPDVVKSTPTVAPPPAAEPPAARAYTQRDTFVGAITETKDLAKANIPKLNRRKTKAEARLTDSTTDDAETNLRTDTSIASKYNNADLALAQDRATAPSPAIAPRNLPLGSVGALRSVTLNKDKEVYTIAPLKFSGHVVDARNKPLAGASVFYKNTATVTDAQGFFSLKIPAKDTANQMTVSLNGYEQADYVLHSATADNVIRLQEAKHSMDEVVVTGYGSKRKEMRASVPLGDSEEQLDSNWIRVYPLPGRLAYEQYLAGAKKALAVDTSIHGTERISFLVDQKGKISDYRIEQSLSPAHDAGLMQAITNGPAWKLLHGRKARALVSMSFP